MTFFQRLEARCREVDSLLCVGLDPHIDDLPEATPAALERWCLDLVAATAPAAAAFKPNAAFFEVFGGAGWEALKRVIAAVPDGIPVILDAKRGDIASTAAAYARAAFQELGADALTVQPYLGGDAVAPFSADPERGVFVLCRTSNAGAAEIQHLRVAGAPEASQVFEAVAARAAEWGGVGLVVGATQPAALARVRELAPDAWILAPGVGAQGGDLEATLAAGLRPDGLGVLVNASRSIARAADPGAAAAALRDAIRAARGRPRAALEPPFPAALAEALHEAGCVRFGTFTLKSGLQSPVYVDLRRIVSDPSLLAAVGEAFLPLLRRLDFARIAALPYAALPIGTAVSLLGGWPLLYPRREVKSYGTKAAIEGDHAPGERVVVLDDLATTGDSKFEAIDKLKDVGLLVEDVVVLIDRESGATEALAEAGFRLHSVFTLSALVAHLHGAGRIDAQQREAVEAFIAATHPGAAG